MLQESRSEMLWEKGAKRLSSGEMVLILLPFASCESNPPDTAVSNMMSQHNSDAKNERQMCFE